MMQNNKIIAVIPARSGSKRIKDKNIFDLNGHPLMAYTIASAKSSGIFERVLVATDSKKYAEIALKYGAEVPSLRSEEISGDRSPDFLWLEWALTSWNLTNYDALSILRPTSPFRSSEDIKKAWGEFKNFGKSDSIRAVTKTSIHPGKMWISSGSIYPFKIDDIPWHSSQTSNLPEVYFQNASLEIAWIKSILRTSSIAGDIVQPYFSGEFSGLDINDSVDIEFIKFLVDRDIAQLPKIEN